METYRILISDFDSELTSMEVSWIGRQFRWGTGGSVPSERMHSYLLALAENTRKPPAACLALAAKHQYINSDVTVMTPEDITKADVSAAE